MFPKFARKTMPQFIHNNRIIFYMLRKSRRARLMRIVVAPGGRITLTIPLFCSASTAEEFLREKALWILAKTEQMKRLGSRAVHYGPAEYMLYKDKARALIAEKIGKLNLQYGYAYKTIRIKNQRTCWGSCSKAGNLNFNFRILFLPERLQDYIIVHELCHLAELNHSAEFWGLVAKAIPEYREIKKELHIKGAGILC